MSKPSCEHIGAATLLPVSEEENVCQECAKTGGTWAHLRKCLECGSVLCCDSSPNRHATQHFKKEGLPAVISAEEGEKWAWCYIDKVLTPYT